MLQATCQHCEDRGYTEYDVLVWGSPGNVPGIKGFMPSIEYKRCQDCNPEPVIVFEPYDPNNPYPFPF
jgi:hypothetical protein